MFPGALPWLLPAALAAQQPAGTLLYRTEPGRAITLTLLAAGRGLALQPESGEAERFRRFVAQHCGHQTSGPTAVWIHAGEAPAGWRGSAGRDLLKGGGIVYWRYAPNLLVPAVFTFEGKSWSLLSAELPPQPIAGP